MNLESLQKSWNDVTGIFFSPSSSFFFVFFFFLRNFETLLLSIEIISKRLNNTPTYSNGSLRLRGIVKVAPATYNRQLMWMILHLIVQSFGVSQVHAQWQSKIPKSKHRKWEQQTPSTKQLRSKQPKINFFFFLLAKWQEFWR